jgi:hypothetical protein
MQIQIWKRLIMLSVLAAVSAHAQAGKQFTVTIPFNFYVAGKTLPAGQYHMDVVQKMPRGLYYAAQMAERASLSLPEGFKMKKSSESQNWSFSVMETSIFSVRSGSREEAPVANCQARAKRV